MLLLFYELQINFPYLHSIYDIPVLYDAIRDASTAADIGPIFATAACNFDSSFLGNFFVPLAVAPRLLSEYRQQPLQPL